MPEVSSSKIILRHFHIDNNKGDFGIGYYMIIWYELMVQIGLIVYFKSQVLQWDGTALHIEQPKSLLAQTGLTYHDMREVAIQTKKPVYKWGYTERTVKNIDGLYDKVDIEQVANNATHLNSE